MQLIVKNRQFATKFTTPRIWEIDFLRGTAIILMVAFHFVFDLNYFFGFEAAHYSHGFWYYAGRLSAILFIFIFGISSVIASRKYSPQQLWQRAFRRGIQLLSFGMLISLVTWLIAPEEMIRFGILHFLGISAILTPLFLHFRWLNIMLATGLIWLGIFVKTFSLNSGLLLAFGVTPSNFATLDYYPLLPWLGVTLLGIAFGNFFYVKNISLLPSLAAINKTFSFFGQHSLKIYLLHQPILLTVLWLVLK